MKKRLQSGILLCFGHTEEVEETLLLCKFQKFEFDGSLSRGRHEDLKESKVIKGPYIKYVAGQIIFVGLMKYFRHVLMSPEIIFDGPQNIFL